MPIHLEGCDLKRFPSSEEPISLLFVVINVKSNHCKLHLKTTEENPKEEEEEEEKATATASSQIMACAKEINLEAVLSQEDGIWL